jgi:DNA-binding transcriptional regulator YdaS (Cro superfamily)
MSREKIRSILGRQFGSKTALARRLGVTPNAISVWLSGRTVSARIAAAAELAAKEILERDGAA